MDLKIIGLTLALTATFNASAATPETDNTDVLKKLDATPVTSLDLGVFKLNYLLTNVFSEVQNNRIGNTSIQHKEIIVFKDNPIGILFFGEGRASKMSETECQTAKNILKSAINLPQILKNTWLNLNDQEIEALTNQTAFAMVVTAKENTNFSIKCTDPNAPAQ